VTVCWKLCNCARWCEWEASRNAEEGREVKRQRTYGGIVHWEPVIKGTADESF
jgi:hypothetical protein